MKSSFAFIRRAADTDTPTLRPFVIAAAAALLTVACSSTPQSGFSGYPGPLGHYLADGGSQ